MKQYTNWLQLIQEYEIQTGRSIDDEIKIATVINQVKGPLRNHLLLNIDDVTTFNDVKKKIVDYFQSAYDVSHQHHGKHSHQGPAPMEIDQINGVEKKQRRRKKEGTTNQR
eukprot:5701165-Amphidinium_carterae.1